MLFSYQLTLCCNLSQATRLFYHAVLTLSRTFLRNSYVFLSKPLSLRRNRTYNTTGIFWCQPLFSFFLIFFMGVISFLYSVICLLNKRRLPPSFISSGGMSAPSIPAVRPQYQNVSASLSCRPQSLYPPEHHKYSSGIVSMPRSTSYLP